MAPGRVLCVVLNVLGALDVFAGKHLFNWHELVLEGGSGDANSLSQSLQVLAVVAGAVVKVVEVDLGHIERVAGLEEDRAGIVARVSLEDGPGVHIVVLRDVDAVSSKVAAEVDRAAKDEGVELAALSS